MVVSFNRTIDVDCQGLPEEVLFSEAVGLLLGFFDRESDHRVAAVQACPGRVARVTFAENGDAAKLFFEELGVIKLGDVECRVVKPPPPPPQLTTVVVSWFPFEGSNDAINTALSLSLAHHNSWESSTISVYVWATQTYTPCQLREILVPGLIQGSPWQHTSRKFVPLHFTTFIIFVGSCFRGFLIMIDSSEEINAI